jgi:hypothetical protein
MVSLNLPSFEYKVKKVDGKIFIFDILRKKYMVLTPEEWVRQHFVHYMIDHLKYPRALIKVETGLIYNTLLKRFDIAVFNREGKPWLLVECKSPQQPVDQEVLRQASVYNLTIKARYVVLTNGLTHKCCEIDTELKTWKVMHELPAYES